MENPPCTRARNAYATSLNTSRILQTYAFPNGLAIRFYGVFGRTMALRPSEYPSLSSDAKWFLEPNMADSIVRMWNAPKSQFYYLNLHHLDVTPLDAIDKAVAKYDASPPGWAMFRHYRQVATRANLNPLLRLPMGQSRYPYVIRYREKGGAYGGGLTGIVDMQTSWRDNTLLVAVRFRQEAYYHDIGSLAGRIDRNGDKNRWPHHQYVINDGHKLIHSVTVQRGGKKFVAKDTGRAVDGYHLFEAAMDSTSLADVWVNVQLRFLDQAPMQLVESLAWGEQARETRMRRAQAAAMAAAATKASDDAQTQLDWANAAIAAGRHGEAIKAFKATLKLYPNAQLAINAAKAFEKRNNRDGALAMLEYGLTLKPGNASIEAEIKRLKTENE